MGNKGTKNTKQSQEYKNQNLSQEQKDRKKQIEHHVVDIKKRKCTDILCLIIYVALSIFFLLSALYSKFNGNIKILTAPFDPDGKGCGIQNFNYPYIYFTSPESRNIVSTVCVSQCPKSSDSVLKCAVNSVIKSCTPSENASPISIYDTKIQNKICMPISQTLQSQIHNGSTSLSLQIIELFDSYVIFIIAFGVSTILCLIIFGLIRKIKNFSMSYLFIINIVVLMLIASLLTFTHFLPIQTTPILSSKLKIIISILLTIMSIILIIIYCINRDSIKNSNFMINQAQKFVEKNLFSCIKLPLGLFLISILCVIIWLFQTTSYLSMAKTNSSSNLPPFKHLDFSSSIINLCIASFFHLIWTVAILLQISNFIVKGAACGYNIIASQYFSQPIQLLRLKHLGSVILGAFLTILLSLFKIIYDILIPDTQKETKSSCLKFIKSCIKKLCCCCQCILKEKFNSWSYSLIFLQGDSYFTAASSCFAMAQQQKKNCPDISTLILLFNVIMKGTVTFGTLLVVVILMMFVEWFKKQSAAALFIMVISAFLGFLVTSFSISIYVDSMEAFFLMYLKLISTDGKGRLLNDQKLKAQYKQLIDFLNQLQIQQQKRRQTENPNEYQQFE